MSRSDNSILLHYPAYEATIGIEVHVQLATATKIFCSCPNQFGSQPNTQICPICVGHPGTLPVLNKKAVDYAILAGLATNCTITAKSDFARKHYMYPDLPKNYQITQADAPICTQGYVPIEDETGAGKQIRLIRIHLEEDAGKNIHADDGKSLVDLNRAGTPLIEIVSYPDISSAYQARAYLMQLHSIVQYLGISNANMEEGSFRADVNISVKKKTATELGKRVELKNINSFKFIVQAIEYEIERQIDIVEAGGHVRQETRLWDSKKGQTDFMRTKEDAQDYRYITDPDLILLDIDQTWVEKLKQQLPELAHQKTKRFAQDYALAPNEITVLVESRQLADFYEETVKLSHLAKLSSNWILRDLLSYLKEHKLDITQSPVSPRQLADLVTHLHKGTINSKVGQDIFADMAATGKDASTIIKEKNLTQIGSQAELEAVVSLVIAENADNVALYQAGNTKLFTFFIGQAMKATQGKANPQMLSTLFKQRLDQQT